MRLRVKIVVARRYTEPLAPTTKVISMNAVQDTGADALQAASPEAELANKCLYYMSLMREVEDRIERKLYRQGKVVGGVYVGRGQEAIPVGSALCSGPDDVLLPSHRDMAVFFIRGVSARRVLAQYRSEERRVGEGGRRQARSQ